MRLRIQGTGLSRADVDAAVQDIEGLGGILDLEPLCYADGQGYRCKIIFAASRQAMEWIEGRIFLEQFHGFVVGKDPTSD